MATTKVSLSFCTVSDEVLAILRCPVCHATMVSEGDALKCVGCARTFPEIRNVVRFVNAEDYAGSFGFQWKKHARTQLDNETSQRSEKAFCRRTGFKPSDLEGKLVLDVGCGMGRFADVASRWGAHVVAIDLSVAVEVAAENLAGRGANCLQADVFSLPFAPSSFDYIYSIGVLHHTPDCERAFKELPGLLKPGGKIAVWLYSAYHKWYRFSDYYRVLTTQMPPRILHRLCYAAVPLHSFCKGLRRVPLIGRLIAGSLEHLFPISHSPDSSWRVLDTFDWYSPKFQSKHTYEEVFRWFEDCGLENLKVIEEPIAVQGQRPTGKG